jgi:NYN domain
MSIAAVAGLKPRARRASSSGEGKFLAVRVRGEVVGDPLRTERVRSFQEKRSDVNLAAYLLSEAYDKRCQLAAVVSGDSDLVEPVRIAHKKLPFGVVILNPNIRGSHDLAKAARQTLIPEAAFRSSLLPRAVRDSEGRVTNRPADW